MRDQKNHNILIGKTGEKLASKFLKSRGYKVLEKNFTSPFGEIDLIALKKHVLTFFEVKTRISDKYGPPLAAITLTKKAHILKNCEYYLMVKNKFNSKCSIDLISIKLDQAGKLQILKHIRNAIIKEQGGNFHAV